MGVYQYKLTYLCKNSHHHKYYHHWLCASACTVNMREKRVSTMCMQVFDTVRICCWQTRDPAVTRVSWSAMLKKPRWQHADLLCLHTNSDVIGVSSTQATGGTAQVRQFLCVMILWLKKSTGTQWDRDHKNHRNSCFFFSFFKPPPH